MPKVGSKVRPCYSRDTKWSLGEELRLYSYPLDGGSSVSWVPPEHPLCLRSPCTMTSISSPDREGAKISLPVSATCSAQTHIWEGRLWKHHMQSGKGAGLEIWLQTQKQHYLYIPAALSYISANPAKSTGWQHQGWALLGHITVQKQHCLTAGASAVLPGQAAQAEPLFTQGWAINFQFTGAQWTGSPVTTFL